MKCPGCGIERKDISASCSICGYKTETVPPATPVTTVAELTIWQGNPSWFYYIPNFIAGVAILIIPPIGIFIIAHAIMARNSQIYTVTNKKIILQSGILSRKTREIGIVDIRSINMDQSIMERVFGLGTIQVGSAAVGSLDMKFIGIKDPEKVRDLIRETRGL